MYVYNVSSEVSFSITGKGCACSCARCAAATLQTVSETDSQTTQILNVWSCSRLGVSMSEEGAWIKLMFVKKDFYYNYESQFLPRLGSVQDKHVSCKFKIK